MRAHALLSPSAAERWWHCVPAARLEDRYDDQSGAAAEEGTLGHAMTALALEPYSTGAPQSVFDDYARLRTLYDEAALRPHVARCAEEVLKLMEPGDKLHLETTLCLDAWVPEGFGSCDAYITNDIGVPRHVIDFKFGKGVRVSAEDNKQMMIYALGAFGEEAARHSIHLRSQFDNATRRANPVTLHIMQPRTADGFTSWSIDWATLFMWGAMALRPRALRAWKATGDEQGTGGKWCLFCKHRKVVGCAMAFGRDDFKDIDFSNFK